MCDIKTTPMDRKQYWPDDYMFSKKNMSYELTSNEVIDSLIKKYNKNNKEVRIYFGTCNQEASITSFKATVQQKIENKAWYAGYISIYGLYNLSTDSVYFVDSLYSDDHYYFHYGFIDSSGKHFYYNKREFALKYNIDSGNIDTLYQGEIPVVPINSSDVLVYSKQDHKLRLLNNNYTVDREIRCDMIEPITVYKVDEFRFLIGKRNYPTFSNEVNMKVLLYDFNNNTETELFIDEIGEIIGVII